MSGSQRCDDVLRLIDEALASVGAPRPSPPPDRMRTTPEHHVGGGTVSAELVLAAAVRSWAEAAMPGEPRAAEVAVAAAISSYADGASVSEACKDARDRIGSWSRHPSRWHREVHPSVSVVA